MNIPIQKRSTIIAFVAISSMIALNLGAQQDNSREVRAVDLSVHSEVSDLASESQQSLEFAQQAMPSDRAPSPKAVAPEQTCPQSSANVNGGTGEATDKSGKESSPLSRWSVLPQGRPPAEQFGSDRAEITPGQDCLPDRNSGVTVNRSAHSFGPALGPSNSSFAAHSKVLAPPVGLASEGESPLSTAFNRKQMTSLTDFSATRAKIPKARSPKKKLAQAKPISPQLQDSIEAGDSMDVPDNKKD